MAAGWSQNAATLRQMAAPQASVKSEIPMRSSPDFLLFACHDPWVKPGLTLEIVSGSRRFAGQGGKIAPYTAFHPDNGSGASAGCSACCPPPFFELAHTEGEAERRSSG